MSTFGQKMVFATNAGRPLAERICSRLSIELGHARVGHFNDGEPDVRILENVRGQDVFIIAPTHAPSDNLMEAIYLGEGARTASAGRVTYVIPYMGTARSDRKDESRKPIGVRLAFKMLEIAQPQRFILLDIHAEQSLACIDHAVCDHLYGSTTAQPELEKLLAGRDFVVASPDKGGGPRAEKYARILGKDDFVFFSKSRPKPGEIDSASIQIIGEVAGKDVVFVDDIIDTAGTIVADAQAARAAGAKNIYVFATHGLFSKDALDRIKQSWISHVFVTDSVHHDPEVLRRKSGGKVKVLSIDWLLAKAISNTHDGRSLSELIL